MICKYCKKKYHYCSSCGFVGYYMDEEFCSDRCWKASEEFKKTLEKFNIFHYEFDAKQIEFLLDMLDGEYMSYEEDFINNVKKHANFNAKKVETDEQNKI